MKNMLKMYKRWKQGRRIKKINRELQDLSWNMQFDNLTKDEIKSHNKEIEKQRMLKNIEKGILESYK